MLTNVRLAPMTAAPLLFARTQSEVSPVDVVQALLETELSAQVFTQK